MDRLTFVAIFLLHRDYDNLQIIFSRKTILQLPRLDRTWTDNCHLLAARTNCTILFLFKTEIDLLFTYFQARYC